MASMIRSSKVLVLSGEFASGQYLHTTQFILNMAMLAIVWTVNHMVIGAKYCSQNGGISLIIGTKIQGLILQLFQCTSHLPSRFQNMATARTSCSTHVGSHEGVQAPSYVARSTGNRFALLKRLGSWPELLLPKWVGLIKETQF